MSPQLFRDLYLNTPIPLFVVLAVFFVVGGYLLRHYIFARQFKRVDAFGVQRFASYTRMQLVLFLERSTMRIAYCFVLLGVFLGFLSAARFFT